MESTELKPQEVAELARAYMARTGLLSVDFARHIAYSYNTFDRFLAGTYAGKEKRSKREAICKAILRFIETHPIEAVDTFHGKLYEIGNVKVMRDAFTRLCEKPTILMVYAPPGSGKTNVALGLIPQFRATGVPIVRIYCRENISPRYLMQRISEKCATQVVGSIERAIRNLRFEFKGRRAALYFDEAQHLSIECLETVRELYDELGWSLCFSGSHQLNRIFTEWAGELEQLERRITDKIHVPPVTTDEAVQIVQSEIPTFDKAKARQLIERSYVQLREGKQYLSIGRVMANIEEIQKQIPDAEPSIATASTEDAA